MLSPPRRVLWLLVLTSCLGKGSCCDSDTSSPPECKDDSECGKGQYCTSGGCGTPTCMAACKKDTDCEASQACLKSDDSESASESLGQCFDVCRSSSQCSAGFTCQPFHPPGGPGQCMPVGTTTGGGTSTKSGIKGGAAGAPARVVVTIGDCSLLDDGECRSASSTLCCPVEGHRLDIDAGCLLDGDSPPAPLWCLPVDAVSCTYLSVPGCYERTLDDGQDEVIVASQRPLHITGATPCLTSIPAPDPCPTGAPE